MSQHKSASQPERTCVVCRKKHPKRALTRLVVSDGQLVIDLRGKMNGRGAYLCDARACWDKAYKSTVLERALRVKLRAEDKQVLSEHLG